MKNITKTYQVYSYDELSEKVQEKVINDYITFILEAVPYENMSNDMRKACDKAERMQTPWFTGSYIWEYCQEGILDNVMDYQYLENGDVFNE